MNRGEIWNTRFDTTEGRELSGLRPALIISGNDMIEFMDLVIVCPLTTSIKKLETCLILHPSEENNLKDVYKRQALVLYEDFRERSFQLG